MANRASQLWQGIREELAQAIARNGNERVLVSSYANGRVKIQELGAPSPLGEEYARLAGFKLEPGAKVLAGKLGDKRVIFGEIENTAPTSRTMNHDLVIEGDLTIQGELTPEGGIGEGIGTKRIFFAWNYAEASTTNAATFTAHSTVNVTLGTGTWEIEMISLANCRASGANGVDMRARISGNDGVTATEFPGPLPGIGIRAHYKVGGIPGGLRIMTTQYKSNGSGTAYLRDVISIITATRTA